VGGNYQGIWRKMGVYDNTSIGYRYDWEEERYEDIYGNEVAYSEVYSNYISQNGNRYIYVAYTDCYLVSEKWDEVVTLKYKAFTAYRLEQVYSPNFINDYIASSGVIGDFNTTWNIVMGGAGTLTGVTSNGMHNSIYWVQKNGKVRLTKNIGKNYLLQRSNKIVAQTLYTSKIVAQSFTNINIIYSAANYGISWALNGNIPSFGKGMDLFFTSMAAIPGLGWAVSGSYWTMSAVSYAITGKWMSEHMDNWVY
jgi:hypothetical protein